MRTQLELCQTINRKSIHLPLISTELCLVIKESIPITPNQLLQTFTDIFVHVVYLTTNNNVPILQLLKTEISLDLG